MVEITVTGFSLPRNPAMETRGILGFFDCDVGPVHLAGCTLVRNREGVVKIASPQIGPKRSRVFVSIPNPEIRRLVADAALRAFTALGGVLPPDDPADEP